jgi:hypothetical protein
MAQPVVTLPLDVTGGGPAAAFVSANTSVKSALGFLGLASDVVQFSGPMVTGAWIPIPGSCSINGIPVAIASWSGTAINPVASAPMAVASGDPGVGGS